MSAVLPRSKVLRIFISHKMPEYTRLAEEIGQKLTLFGGDRIKVTHAGMFPAGADFRSQIERELDDTDWLILLKTDRDGDWGFCMFECGYFRAQMRFKEASRLIPICKDAEGIPTALSDFNAVLIGADPIHGLLQNIYVDPPWALSEHLQKEALQRTAQEIVAACENAIRVEQNFDVATSISLEIDLTEPNRALLDDGVVPADAVATGTLDWQGMFGRQARTGAWLWKDLTGEMPYRAVYEWLIATMITEAIDGRSPPGTLIRAANREDPSIYRLTLRRYEAMSNKKLRFHFTAGRLDLPFDIYFGRQQDAAQAVMFHMVCLTWYFRRRMVEGLYRRALDLRSSRAPDPALVASLYRDIRQELKQMQAQSIVRELNGPALIERALGDHGPEVQELFERGARFAELEQGTFEATRDGATGLSRVVERLFELAELNYAWYQRVADSYARLSRLIERPESPNPPASPKPHGSSAPRKRGGRLTRAAKPVSEPA